jgi:hypothetical protein
MTQETPSTTQGGAQNEGIAAPGADVATPPEAAHNDTKTVKVQVYLSSGINDAFRALINTKYRVYQKGLLSYETELALGHWIALHRGQSLSASAPTPPNPPSRVAVVFNQVKDYLLTHHYSKLKTGSQINLDHLQTAIKAVRGSDPRTYFRWLRAFEEFGLVKKVAGKVYEIL